MQLILHKERFLLCAHEWKVGAKQPSDIGEFGHMNLVAHLEFFGHEVRQIELVLFQGGLGIPFLLPAAARGRASI